MRVVIDNHEYYNGAAGTIIGVSGDWYLIHCDNGFEGYFSADEFSMESR